MLQLLAKGYYIIVCTLLHQSVIFRFRAWIPLHHYKFIGAGSRFDLPKLRGSAWSCSRLGVAITKHLNFPCISLSRTSLSPRMKLRHEGFKSKAKIGFIAHNHKQCQRRKLRLSNILCSLMFRGLFARGIEVCMNCG